MPFILLPMQGKAELEYFLQRLQALFVGSPHLLDCPVSEPLQCAILTSSTLDPSRGLWPVC